MKKIVEEKREKYLEIEKQYAEKQSDELDVHEKLSAAAADLWHTALHSAREDAENVAKLFYDEELKKKEIEELYEEEDDDDQESPY